MSDADVEELLKLPVEERLHLVELIWGSLTLRQTGLELVTVPLRRALGRLA